MRADRLLQIVALLRQHGRLSASNLARRLEVAPRTIHRDLESLSASGVPVYAEQGRSGGYALLPGYRPAKESLTPDEARALFLATGGTVPDALGLDQEFDRALRKLSTGLPEQHTRTIGQALERIVFDPDGWGRVTTRHPAALPRVLHALEDERRLRIDYRSRGSQQVRRRTIDPWGLVQAAGTWYLIAAHRGRPRTYRLDRMQSVTELTARAHRPAGLDLAQEWHRLRAAWRDRPAYPVELRVLRSQADLVVRQLGLALASDPTRTPEGPEHERLSAEVTTLRGAVGVLLGCGDWLEVLSPPELRALMVEIADQARAVHQERS
ncbi:DNA-binding transcriptional regulator [Enemella dayhoffiae]|uniref:DNA-binding transcriptional regulator n=1 Tax=Enemella dayhoffiae TaxID=2016507 RepID=A0A255H364_9ACTN|nr:YafY family protein [Enemella dayhoffiae]OYO22057.1 DNA-binding transcriptional regulator [Enemella dayhoffiae]